MRNIIIGLVFVVIIITSVGIVYSVDGKSIRNQEVTDALDSAVEGTVETLMKKTYTIDNSDQFVADMLEALIIQINSDCELTVNVLDQDFEKGLLSVEAIETFKYPNGNIGTVSSTKTVILEHGENSTVAADKTCTAEFYITTDTGSILYKRYTLNENSVLPIPAVPMVDGKTFVEWQLNGSKFDFTNGEGGTYTLNENIVLTARFD